MKMKSEETSERFAAYLSSVEICVGFGSDGPGDRIPDVTPSKKVDARERVHRSGRWRNTAMESELKRTNPEPTRTNANSD